jgi:hypothetical protein
VVNTATADHQLFTIIALQFKSKLAVVGSVDKS